MEIFSSLFSYRRLALKVSACGACLSRCWLTLSSGIRIKTSQTKLKQRKNSSSSPKRTKFCPTVRWIILTLLVLLVFHVWHSSSFHPSFFISVLSDDTNASLLALVSLVRWSIRSIMSIKLGDVSARGSHSSVRRTRAAQTKEIWSEFSRAPCLILVLLFCVRSMFNLLQKTNDENTISWAEQDYPMVTAMAVIHPMVLIHDSPKTSSIVLFVFTIHSTSSNNSCLISAWTMISVSEHLFFRQCTTKSSHIVSKS